MVTFGQRLKELRLKNNILQKDLAEKLNLTQKAVSFYEKDEREPNLKTLILLAEYFDVSLDYLLGKTDSSDHVIKEDTHISKSGRLNVKEFEIDVKNLIESLKKAVKDDPSLDIAKIDFEKTILHLMDGLKFFEDSLNDKLSKEDEKILFKKLDEIARESSEH